MTHNKFWWNCKYLETDRNLGVAFCRKTNDFCNKSKCDKIKLKSQKHNQFYRERIKELEKENEQLKKELVEFKKWEKHVGDVKRENLDRVFKMSIYEIAEAFEYYEKRINKLEKEMRK